MNYGRWIAAADSTSKWTTSLINDIYWSTSMSFLPYLRCSQLVTWIHANNLLWLAAGKIRAILTSRSVSIFVFEELIKIWYFWPIVNLTTLWTVVQGSSQSEVLSNFPFFSLPFSFLPPCSFPTQTLCSLTPGWATSLGKKFPIEAERTKDFSEFSLTPLAKFVTRASQPIICWWSP